MATVKAVNHPTSIGGSQEDWKRGFELAIAAKLLALQRRLSRPACGNTCMNDESGQRSADDYELGGRRNDNVQEPFPSTRSLLST